MSLCVACVCVCVDCVGQDMSEWMCVGVRPPCPGRLVLDTTSHPNWKMCCNAAHCNVIVLFKHAIKVTRGVRSFRRFKLMLILFSLFSKFVC